MEESEKPANFAPRRKLKKAKSIYKKTSREIRHSQTSRVYLFNFFLFASVGCLFPFLPIFFKLLGFSTMQNGVLVAVRGMVTFWSGPMMSSFHHLAVFTNAAVFVCVVGLVVDTFSLALVQDGFRGGLAVNTSICSEDDRRTHSQNSSSNLSSTFQVNHRRKDVSYDLLALEPGFTKLRRSVDYFADDEDEQPSHRVLHRKRNGRTRKQRTRMNRLHRAHRNQHSRRHRIRNSHRRHMNEGRRHAHHLKLRVGAKRHKSQRLRIAKTKQKIDIKTTLPSQQTKTSKTDFQTTTQMPIFKTSLAASLPSVQEINTSTTPTQSSPKNFSTSMPILSLNSTPPISANVENKKGQFKTFLHNAQVAIRKGFPMPETFFACLIITILSEVFLSVLTYKSELVDEVGRYFCPSVFAMNRLWGRIGYCVTAFSTAYISWRLTCSYTSSNTFYFHFYGFVAAGGIVLLTSLCLPLKKKPKKSPCKDWCTPWKLVLCNLQAFLFSITLIVVGLCDFLIDAYLLWHAHNLGGTELVFGVMITMGVVTDVLFYCFIGISIQWIGHSGLLSFSLLVSGAQFIAIPYIHNAWLLIPVQVLRGIATAGSKSALFDFSNEISPLGMENSVQTLFQSIYFGIGYGIGGLYVSFVSILYGITTVFSGMSAICFIYGTVYSLVSLIQFTVNSGRRLTGQEYEKIQPDIIPENDWLVEALEESEKKYDAESP